MGGRIDAVGRPGDHGQALGGQIACQQGGDPPAVIAGGTRADDRHRRLVQTVQVALVEQQHRAVGNGVQGIGKGGAGAGDQGDIGAGEQVELALRPLARRRQLARIDGRAARPRPLAGTTAQPLQRLTRPARLTDEATDEDAAQTGQKRKGQPLLGVRTESQGSANR